MPTKKQLQNQVTMLNDALSTALSVSPITDNNFFPLGMSGSYTDRNQWDRVKIFSESLRAWRVNPIARRIVRLMTSFTIGKEIKIKAKDKSLQTFLNNWYRKNELKKNLRRWKDEDTRTGNLFILFNVLENNLSIMRAIPAENVFEIKTDENDIERELYYFKDSTETEGWEAYDPNKQQNKFVIHFASNQPVGSPWGEADLAPLLVWIGRFSAWLENRARLNQFRSAFMYIVNGSYESELERATREKTLMASPPKPGSILVTNKNNGEEWGILSATLDSFDASMDGVALKKMILEGIGHPMHWHAEPEGATQTTAEASGTPTFRTLEETQSDFFDLIQTCATIAATIAGFEIKEGDIWIEGQDITERDNATLALALGRSYPHLADLFDRHGIDDKEFLRITYKMFGEIWDDKTPAIKRKPLIKPAEQSSTITDAKTDATDPKEDE